MRLDWNRERKRTRDRLLEYDDAIVPPRPRAAGLAMIYPWENIPISVLTDEIYKVVQERGFIGDEDDFYTKFISLFNSGTVVVDDFPENGDEKNLYVDSPSGTVFFFKDYGTQIDPDAVAANGGIMVTDTAAYIPIRALLIENTLIEGGDA